MFFKQQLQQKLCCFVLLCQPIILFMEGMPARLQLCLFDEVALEKSSVKKTWFR
jgi:hypothetical protein